MGAKLNKYINVNKNIYYNIILSILLCLLLILLVRAIYGYISNISLIDSEEYSLSIKDSKSRGVYKASYIVDTILLPIDSLRISEVWVENSHWIIGDKSNYVLIRNQYNLLLKINPKYLINYNYLWYFEDFSEIYSKNDPRIFTNPSKNRSYNGFPNDSIININIIKGNVDLINSKKIKKEIIGFVRLIRKDFNSLENPLNLQYK